MRKPVVAAAAVLLIAGTSLAAAQRFGDPADAAQTFQRPQFGADDIAAFTDARIAGMRAGLKLTPDQEKNWPAFETAYRNLAQLRAERLVARRSEARPGNIVEFMQRRADVATKRAAAFKQFADAAAPLYQSLDESQKRRFGALAQMLRSSFGAREHRGRFRERAFGGPRFGEGFGHFRTGATDQDEDATHPRIIRDTDDGTR